VKELIDEAVALLRRAKEKHGDKLVYPSSMAVEGSVMIDLIARHGLDIPVITLDTGRLPQATYEVIETVEARYGIKVQVIFPDCREVEEMVREQGVNLFYRSPENRKRCCEVRKVLPLRRALQGKEAWITGRRRAQAKNRAEIAEVEDDPVYGLIKYNPLRHWTEDDVWAYIREFDVPYNRLHDQHFVSIGCEPCTRAIAVGEDPRSGRWWWENEETLAECGLHVVSLKSGRGEGEQGEGI